MKTLLAAGTALVFAMAIGTLAGAQMQSGQSDQPMAGSQGPGTVQSQPQGTSQDQSQTSAQQSREQSDRERRSAQKQSRQQDEQARQKAASMYVDGKQVMGAPVKDRAGKDIGKVSNIILDRSGKVAFVIMSHGGVAGFGGKNISIPVGAVTLSGSGDDRKVVLNITDEQLNSAPEYTSVADLVNPTYMDVTYRFFGLQPQWSDQGSSTAAQRMQTQPGQQSSAQQSQWHFQDTAGQQQKNQ